MQTCPTRLVKQRGTALVIGLVLLAILTLLAITGMNTASTELMMAGGEQYRQNAFQAAETGIERAITTLATVPQDGIAVVAAPTLVPNSTTDRFATVSQYMGEDKDVPGFSAGKFSGLHYRIESTGTSARNANAVHEQGAYLVASAGGGESVPDLPGPPPVE
jgi:type IV pilus assembly protein PilX